jgi:hypothetical protein
LRWALLIVTATIAIILDFNHFLFTRTLLLPFIGSNSKANLSLWSFLLPIVHKSPSFLPSMSSKSSSWAVRSSIETARRLANIQGTFIPDIACSCWGNGTRIGFATGGFFGFFFIGIAND